MLIYYSFTDTVTIQVIAQPLFRKQIISVINQLDLGEKCIVYDERESIKVDSSDLIILQDESYLNRKPDYESEVPIVLIANLKYFHYWVSMGGGYLTPKDKLCSFKQAVKAVINENNFISGEVIRFLRLDNKERQEILLQKELEASLTTSEIEVLLKTANGSSAAKIANNRRCSVSTVYTHNKNIRRKLKLKYKFSTEYFVAGKVNALESLFMLNVDNKRQLLAKQT